MSKNIFKGLPDNLKDTVQYEIIEKRVAKIMKADHTHKSVSTFVKCKTCQANVKKRDEYLQSLGFEGIQQFMYYKRAILIMKEVYAKKAKESKK